MAPAPPISPEKRVTRARAAARNAVIDSKTSNTKVAAKPSARRRGKAVEEEPAEREMPVVNEPLRKSARRAIAAPARRLKVIPLSGTTGSQESRQEESEPSQIAPKPRATRSKKPATNNADLNDTETTKQPAKSRRQTSGVTKSDDVKKTTAPRLRGRPKKGEEVQDEVMVESKNTDKRSRARNETAGTNTKALAVAPLKPTVPKKKVTFQDAQECDKENQPVLRARGAAKAKSAAPTSGIRAKPVRKPAATSGTNAKQDTTRATAEATTQRILTPKKITQVAKSSSPADSDEDELNGAKTPIRDLSQSPRRIINIARQESPVKRLDFGSQAPGSPPLKSQLTSALLSPARRPGPSPFKDAFKDPPKRGDFFLKLSNISKSNAGNKAQDPASSGTMLFQSPKRVAVGPSIFPQSASKASNSPFKASLLRSPPKRPISPQKAFPTTKTSQSPAIPEVDDDVMSPDITVSSHFRASQSPERSSHVHKMTAEEIVEGGSDTIDFDESIVDIRSPLKLKEKIENVSSQTQKGPENTSDLGTNLGEICLMAQVEVPSHPQGAGPTVAVNSSTTQSVKDVDVAYTAPANIMPREQIPINAASFLFRASHISEEDDSSEDELQSPTKTFQVQTPATVQGDRSHLSVSRRSAGEQNPGLTPLATQLSGWLASSPDKQFVKKIQPEGGFSPVAAQHVPGEVIIDRQSPATSRVSTESRLSRLARQSVGCEKSVGPRNSIAAFMTQTPDRSSYFADEMAVKDLEEAIESMQAEVGECDMLQGTNRAETADDALPDDSDHNEVVEETELVPFQQARNSSASPQWNMEDNVSAEVEAEARTEEEQDRHLLPQTSQKFTASSAYFDENIAPTTPAAAVPEQSFADTQQSSTTAGVKVPSSDCAPFVNFTTPSRPEQQMSRFANTVVSKVPLRPEGHVSPIKVPKKRSRSLSAGPSSVKKTPLLHAFGISWGSTVDAFSPAQNKSTTPASAITTPGQTSFAIDDFGDSTLDGIQIDEDDENLPPFTPTVVTATPSKTVKAQNVAAPCGVLQGAVVFVDVHTTEGADASGIFIELLTQMGARCVRNWSWNPRASMGVDLEEATATPGAGMMASGKIGITHVVYKDGGKRTLEKVRDTEGLVKCVGVGWVLE